MLLALAALAVLSGNLAAARKDADVEAPGGGEGSRQGEEAARLPGEHL